MKLLEERVNDQKQGTLSNVTKLTKKKKTINELLAESNKEDTFSVIHSIGVIKFEYNLTYNSVSRQLTYAQRKQFMFLLAHCIGDNNKLCTLILYFMNL